MFNLMTLSVSREKSHVQIGQMKKESKLLNSSVTQNFEQSVC